MALDELTATIETIKQRIEDHRTLLAAKEARTRQVLIDPLLTALGWDVSDPSLVEVEYDVRGKSADYALKVNGKPVAVIEAKRLGRQLIDDDTMQVMNYANTEGIEYMVLTNGDQWNMYSVFERGAIEERVVMELRISDLASHVNALKSLSMWRANLSSGNAPTVAGEPVLEPESTPPSGKDLPTGGNTDAFKDGSGKSGASKNLEEGWITLNELVRNRGRSPSTRTWFPRPQCMRFPNRTPIDVDRWPDFWLNWALWLSEEIQDPTRWESINDTLPNQIKTLAQRISLDDSGFRGKAHRLPNGWLIDMGIGSQGDLWRAIDYSSQHFGIDLDAVHVRF